MLLVLLIKLKLIFNRLVRLKIHLRLNLNKTLYINIPYILKGFFRG
jgi:hypothetical protein